jgi:hypothetical protein
MGQPQLGGNHNYMGQPQLGGNHNYGATAIMGQPRGVAPTGNFWYQKIGFLIPFLKNNDCLEFLNCPGRGASRSAPTKMPLLSLAYYQGNGIRKKMGLGTCLVPGSIVARIIVI